MLRAVSLNCSRIASLLHKVLSLVCTFLLQLLSCICVGRDGADPSCLYLSFVFCACMPTVTVYQGGAVRQQGDLRGDEDGTWHLGSHEVGNRGEQVGDGGSLLPLFYPPKIIVG